MPYGVDWVDAFTARPFAGNGCAVVYEAAHLPVDICTAFVRETGLVECTFIGPSDKADLRVRYFLATREIPFAGHPTIATVASLVDRGLAEPGALTIETGAGVISVDIGDDDRAPWITMTQNRPEFGPPVPPDLVADIYGLALDDIIGTPRLVSTGMPFCVTVLRDKEALARARLDAHALERFREAMAGPESDVMEPYLVTLGGVTDAGDTFSRLLLAPPLPAEDPFTGSATGSMAAYLWSEGLMEDASFTAEQGHWMGRPGQARVSRIGTAKDIAGVRVGGQGYVLMRGFLNLG